MVSIKDVAKRAGVSISTVSHTLNGTKYVSAGLAKKVLAAVEELNYEVDPIARNMKNQHSQTIGVITVDICGLFYPYVVKGIYEKINQYGYNILICDLSNSFDSRSSLEKEISSFKKMAANRVDGIVFASTVSGQMEQTLVREILKITNARKKIPLVSLEKDFSKYGIDSVFIDNVDGGYKATRHLIDCGCKHIAHITGPIFSSAGIDRLDGYKKALEEAGVKVDVEASVANGNYTHQSGYIAMSELLKKYPQVDGVFAGNDQTAVGALKALAQNGRRVPDDVKVIGFDNVFISDALEPGLSTIDIRKKYFGREAADILMSRIKELDDQTEDKKPVVATKIECSLVVRKSTSKETGDDWILTDW